MSRARAAVLEQLGRHVEPTTVGILAGECGQHTNTVREHLDALTSAGLVVRTTGPAQGRGRPAIRYSAVPSESVRPQMREYVNLVTALSAQIDRALPDPRAFSVEAGRHMSVSTDEHAVPGMNAADASLALLAELGFDPHVDDGTDAGESADEGPRPPHAVRTAPEPNRDGLGREILTVRLRECPLLEAARRHPDVVCSVHLGALLGSYDQADEPTDGVGVVPFAEPGACLAYLPVSGTDGVEV